MANLAPRLQDRYGGIYRYASLDHKDKGFVYASGYKAALKKLRKKLGSNVRDFLIGDQVYYCWFKDNIANIEL